MKRIALVGAHGATSRLNEISIARLKKALKLWKKGKVDLLFLSGGMFARGQKVSAAQMMENWLFSKGVPKEVMIKDEESLDSFHHVQHFLEKMKNGNLSQERKQYLLVLGPQQSLRVFVSFLSHGVLIWIRPDWKWTSALDVFLLEPLVLLVHLLNPRGNERGLFGGLIRKSREKRKADGEWALERNGG